MKELLEIGFAVIAGFALGFGAAVLMWASERAKEMEQRPDPQPPTPARPQAVRLHPDLKGPDVNARLLHFGTPATRVQETGKVVSIWEGQLLDIMNTHPLDDEGRGWRDSGDEHRGA
jgi:hypothetical protein